MTEQPTGGRDVLAELDDIGQYLEGLASQHSATGWGQDENSRDLAQVLPRLKDLAANIIALHGEYSSGITHEQRVARSTGADLDAAASAARIAELERQLAEAKGGQA